MKSQVTVKEIDANAFQELKTEAVRRKITVGTALTLAIENWLSSLKKTNGNFSELKQRNWGKGTEHLSEQIDQMLYGE